MNNRAPTDRLPSRDPRCTPFATRDGSPPSPAPACRPRAAVPTFRGKGTACGAIIAREKDLATPEAFRREARTSSLGSGSTGVDRSSPSARRTRAHRVTRALVRSRRLHPDHAERRWPTSRRARACSVSTAPSGSCASTGSLRENALGETGARHDLQQAAAMSDVRALARPGVVWFGEGIERHGPRPRLRSNRSCDVFLSIGTSSIVYPAAGLVHEARRAGAFTAGSTPSRRSRLRRWMWRLRCRP